MDGIVDHSRLFQDLLNLEKDFNYNLNLLKVRDSEIERCNKTNKTLQEILKCKLTEIEELTCKRSNLEIALQQAEQERAREKQIYNRMLQDLQNNLNETNRVHQTCLENHKEEIMRKETEVEKYFSNITHQTGLRYTQKLDAVEQQLRKEIESASKTKTHMQSMIDENMSLRNKLRQLESRYNSETSFYKNEIRTIQSKNSNLNCEIESLNESYASQGKEFHEIKLLNDNLKAELCINNEKIYNLISENKENINEINKLRQYLQECAKKLKDLITDNQRIERENNQLKSDYANLKKIKAESVGQKTFCTIQERAVFDETVRQNCMLREVVKAMRKEREDFQTGNAGNSQDAERRIENLEQLTLQLKQSMLNRLAV